MKRYRYLLVVPLLIGLATTGSAQEKIYKEIGGQVTIEAENYSDRLQNEDDEKLWTLIPTEADGEPELENFRGTGYLQVLPDANENKNSPDRVGVAPYVDYKVEITQTGEYQLYARWLGWSGNSDSMYVQVVELLDEPGGALEGGSAEPWYRFAQQGGADFDGIGEGAGWSGEGAPNSNSAGGDNEPAVWTISQAGTYTIRFSPREDGCALDALVFQLSSMDPVEGEGPGESPLANVDPEPLKLTRVDPSPDSPKGNFNKGISVTLLEGTTTLADGSLTLALDGQTVTPTIEKNGQVVSASFMPDAFFAPNSPHSAKVTFKDSAGKETSQEWSWTTRDYISIPSAWKVDGNTSENGFRVRTHQVGFGGRANTVAAAEQQLAGGLTDPDTGDAAENLADDFGFEKDGYYNEESYINYNQDAVDRFDGGSNAGRFGATGPSEDAPKEEHPVPGIPGLDGGTDNFSQEILTYLDLPAGLIEMTLNSDDGFKISISPGDPRDQFGLTVGQFNGGRGAADSNMKFVIEEAGVYPARLIWYEGGGGANAEWSVRRASDRERILVNDRDSEGHVKAYRSAQGGSPPYASAVSPAPGAENIDANAGIHVVIQDGATKVDSGSVSVSVDGAAVNADVRQSGGATTVAWENSRLFAPLSKHMVEVGYSHGGTAVTRSWSFTVADYATLDCETGTTPGSGSSSGFNFIMHQVDQGRATTIKAAEDQLAGLLVDADGNKAENVADPTSGTIDGIINFDQDGADVGNFTADNDYLDDFIPGIPGLTASTDNITGEFTAFVEFPEAGWVTMGVNSDDGFEVSNGLSGERDAPALGGFNGGRGSADTIFGFVVPAPGVYPLRLIWYEGGGGANVEWFSVNGDGEKIPVNAKGGLSAYRKRSDKKIDCPDEPVVVEPPVVVPPVVVPPIVLPPVPGAGGAVSGITRGADGKITIDFTGTLQSSDTVNGAYAPVAGASSPFTVDPSGSAKFYIAR